MYKDNLLHERQALAKKYLYSQVRKRIKITGAKMAHIDKLYKYHRRVGY